VGLLRPAAFFVKVISIVGCRHTDGPPGFDIIVLVSIPINGEGVVMVFRFFLTLLVVVCFAGVPLVAQESATKASEQESGKATEKVAEGSEKESESAAKETTKHSFVGFGKANGIAIVGEDGETEWQLDLPASDGWMLESGNILAAIYPCKQFPKGGVGEIDRSTKKFVWEYHGQQKQISTVQQIGDDKFLVAELGATPRAIVINRKGDLLSEMAFACQKGNAHMQTRMLRLLPNGNYIAPHLLDFAVKEYDPSTGKVVKTFPTDDRGREKRDWPFTAIRLSNGNTVIGCTNGNRVIEVDSDGEIVWSVDNSDLGEDLIDDACGVQRLPNGNTVITSYHAKGGSVKLTEVDRDKNIVWRFNGLKAGFHHFQVLTTNGQSLDSALK